MPAKKIILSEINCPNCNAIAQMRIKEKSGQELVYIVCKKCKLNKYTGLNKIKGKRIESRTSHSLPKLGGTQS